MTDHLSVPGAFAYIRLVPARKEPEDSDGPEETITAATAALPVEASVEASLAAPEPDASAHDAVEGSASKSSAAKVLASAQPTPPLHLHFFISTTHAVFSLWQGKTNVAIDAWKQKTHDRRQHHHEFDRFFNEVRRNFCARPERPLAATTAWASLGARRPPRRPPQLPCCHGGSDCRRAQRQRSYRKSIDESQSLALDYVQIIY